MASAIMSSLLATASSPPSLSSKTSYSPQNARRRPTTFHRQWKLCNLSIRSSGDNSTDESPLIKLDRRNMLIGGGLYGTTLGLIHDQKAVAKPIAPPNLSKCNSSSDGDVLYPCCPPYAFGVLKPEEIPDYQIPSFTTLRKRKPARDLSDGELSNLKSAISKMKSLGGTDPWSFVQQANIHCAFCNGAYNQVGFDKVPFECNNVPLQVHNSSIFLPWHRWYIYFYERILGKLMGDESFALPYWDYDHPDGMEFPKIYDETPLLDKTRAEHARAGNYVDLHYSFEYCNTPRPKDKVIEENLCYFRRIFNEGAKDRTLFIGKTPEAGQESAVAGSLEILHNVVHQWVGKCESPNFDMGNFITAARDPIFFGHHMNVDRLWEIYRTQFMSTTGFETDNPDWLDASFIFYDENNKVVKVQVKDALDITKLGYSFADLSVEWKNVLCPRQPKTKEAPVAEFGSTTRVLAEYPIRILAKRPKSSRRESDIEKTVEVVVVDGIEVVHTSSTRFDVYISTPDNSTDFGDFAGSFVTVAHGHEHGKTADSKAKKQSLKLGITNLVAELNAETAESLVVTLVPRTGVFLIDGVYIEQNNIK
ncbi:polyphenol oxidase, chloroplastic-like [Magnolia sinica]|uniref:polyphenol oxidase, chloroplastic-like n=1 Tax=Magnolia sinica TaxID=86752 RepID=UPI0026591C4E|nr:polyphenol oxidase, chloroplastic-like [Magnolia sinica]